MIFISTYLTYQYKWFWRGCVFCNRSNWIVVLCIYNRFSVLWWVFLYVTYVFLLCNILLMKMIVGHLT